MFIVLLSFSFSLACYQTKCLLLNDESCMVSPTPTDLNSAELKYYPFMISLDQYVMSYLQKYVFQKKQKTSMLKHLTW